jgi:hypothetical protein
MRALVFVAAFLLVVVAVVEASKPSKRCSRLHSRLSKARASLGKAQKTAEACKDEDFACIDGAYKVVVRQRR